ANFLLMDEPTNHLDMDSIEALTCAIQNFDGAVVIVTHSEELLRRVCDRLIIFAKDGAEYFDGGYDLFLEKIGWEEEEQEQKVKSAPKSNNKESKKLKAELVRERNKLTSPLKKQVEKLESSIMEIEELLELNHQELIEVSNSGDSAKLMELSKLVSTQESEVEKRFELLETAQTELDELTESYEQKLLEI
ncbi:MAG: ABC transporter ATP-binding protein, partial [Sulfurimonas sp.]|nr:ABC transporter ATP-binding protein [Sulfurimonas sp.]